MALEQLGLATAVVLTAFAITFGALMLGLAIAFGLGGRDAARTAARTAVQGQARSRSPTRRPISRPCRFQPFERRAAPSDVAAGRLRHRRPRARAPSSSSTSSPRPASGSGRCCRSDRPAMAIRRISASPRSPATRCSISLDRLIEDGLLTADDVGGRLGRRRRRRPRQRRLPRRHRPSPGALAARARSLRRGRRRPDARSLRALLPRAGALAGRLRAVHGGQGARTARRPGRRGSRTSPSAIPRRSRAGRSAAAREIRLHKLDAVPVLRAVAARARRLPRAIDRRSWATCRSSSRTTAPTSGRTASCSGSTPMASRPSSPACRPTTSAPTGQLWGNPHYRWDALAADRLRLVGRALSRAADAGRSRPHRPLPRLRSVVGSAGATPRRPFTASGSKGPGAALFDAVQSALATGAPAVRRREPRRDHARRRSAARQFGLPGMAILQFAFGTDPQAPDFRPHNYPRNRVVYTGTHDNDTTVGWWTGDVGHSTRRDADIANERELRDAVSRPRRSGDPLGLHPRGAGVGRRHGDRAGAGPAGPRQRGADEPARNGQRQLALATASGTVDSGHDAEAGVLAETYDRA